MPSGRLRHVPLPALGDHRHERPPAVCGHLINVPTHFNVKLPPISGHLPKGHATRNDIVDDIVDVSSSTMAFNVAKIASARSSLTISLTKSLRVAGPLRVRGQSFIGCQHLL